MNPQISGQQIVDGETRIDLAAIRSFERTDITFLGWIYVFLVVFAASWISGFEGVQWWMCTIGAVVLLLLPAFVIPLSSLKLHTEDGTRNLRGTTSCLHDITDVLSARLSSEADRESKGEQDSGGNR